MADTTNYKYTHTSRLLRQLKDLFRLPPLLLCFLGLAAGSCGGNHWLAQGVSAHPGYHLYGLLLRLWFHYWLKQLALRRKALRAGHFHLTRSKSLFGGFDSPNGDLFGCLEVVSKLLVRFCLLTPLLSPLLLLLLLPFLPLLLSLFELFLCALFLQSRQRHRESISRHS